jgi:hypothetical protein
LQKGKQKAVDTSEIRTHAPEGTALAGLRDNHSAIVPYTRRDTIVALGLSITPWEWYPEWYSPVR